MCGADGNFGTNNPRFLAVRIFEHERNVTISFNFYAIEAASEVVPFLFSCDSCIRLGRQRLFWRCVLSTRESPNGVTD